MNKFRVLAILVTAILVSCSSNNDEITRKYTGLQVSVDKIGPKSKIEKKISTDLKKNIKKEFQLKLAKF